MVRNVASIASLCESSPHRPNSAQPPEQEQRDTSSTGSISYPKQRQADDKARSDGNPVLSYYQKELLLLEQQNKKRLFMARQESEQESATSMQPSPDRRAGNCRNPALEEYERQLGLLDEESKNRQLEREPEQEPTGGLVDHGGPQVLQDHEMEVILLEQQRTMDVLMARREAKARQRSVPLCSNIGSERHENHALRDYQMELKLLEPLNRKRLLQAKRDQEQEQSRNSRFTPATKANAEMYAEPFCKFLSENPTVFHAVAAMKRKLKAAGFTQLSERGSWDIKRSGSYFVERNGSALIAFSVGAKYESGNGAAVVAGHIDALTAKLKPVSKVPNKAGYLQLGVAPYAGGLNSTWWDRDLGIAGRVHLRKDGKIVTKLVNLDYPIARVPTLAPHFGAAAQGPFNPETQMVPILGLESSDPVSTATAPEPFSKPSLLGDSVGSFAKTQPPALVEAIEEALASTIDWDEEEDGDLSMHSSDDKDDDEARYAVGEIVNWELELYDVQAATRGGLHKELIYGGRVDDKLCSWAALEALVEAQQHDADSSIFKVVGLFDDEEIGSLLRQGARGNFLPSVLERAAGSLADHKPTSDLMGRTYANSFLVSSDVTHAVNPNFLSAYLENHAPHLNVGVAIAADPNGHMTTDSVSTTIFQRCAEKAGAKLQVFQIRNDSRSGGTIGPMTSSATGMRAIDAGLPQLSMHSIRATTGALDPGLGVITFKAFLNGFEEVDKEFK